MKRTVLLIALTILIPLALLAGKGAKSGPTLSATSCSLSATQNCILITGSGYGVSKIVTIDVDGVLVNDTFKAPANSNGQIALYVYNDYAPGYYTVTSYNGTRVAATSGFEVQ